MSSFIERIKMPHVFVLLAAVILVCSIATYFIPSGTYERETRTYGELTRNVIVPGSYETVDKHISLKGIFIGDDVEGKATPVSFLQFLTAIPRGMEAHGDIIFFIFVIGGVFGILQRTGTIIAALSALLNVFRDSAALLTIVLMTAVAIGGSTLGMGEEFIPLVPLFLIVSKELGYDRIFGLALVILAADIGFASATFNPFTVQIAQRIAEVPPASGLGLRFMLLVVCLAVTIVYVLRYGARVKRDPSLSLMAGDDFSIDEYKIEKQELTGGHVATIISCLVIFVGIMLGVQFLGWWMAEMGGGFLLMGIVAVIFSDISVEESAKAFVHGLNDMVVAALVVGFAKGVEVVLSDAMVLDTIIYSAASMLQSFSNIFAALGMLVFQTTLNFFIPSGSGQAAVTMPLMAPLSDVLGLTRQTAVLAFTCGDGYSNTIIPTSGVLMAMLSLAKIPYMKWLKFMLPLFGILMLISAIFLVIAVLIGY